MLDLKNISKTFNPGTVNEKVALENVNLHLDDGDFATIVGSNGAGKSTIIRHLAGIYRQDSGEVLLDGQPVYENPAVKRRMTVIGDDWYYFPQANIREMARFFAGLYPAFSWERYEKLKQVFPLDEKMMLRRMSKGMQKQAAFHLTVCTRPRTLILDEPVDGLDPVMRRQVMGLILSDVAGHGTTVLISSHNLRELEDVCDYVGIMNRGKMLLEKSLADMQGSTVKLQLVGDAPKELDILNATVSGRLKTLIVRGEAEEVGAKMAACKPAYFDVLPLSLEEIFIYELGGVDYEIKDILL